MKRATLPDWDPSHPNIPPDWCRCVSAPQVLLEELEEPEEDEGEGDASASAAEGEAPPGADTGGSPGLQGEGGAGGAAAGGGGSSNAAAAGPSAAVAAAAAAAAVDGGGPAACLPVVEQGATADAQPLASDAAAAALALL